MEAKTKKGIIVSGIVLAIVGLAFYLKKKNNNSDNPLDWNNIKKELDNPLDWNNIKKELDQQKK